FTTDPAVSLSWLYGFAGRTRGRAARRPRQRGAGGGGGRERADHSLFGGLVEFAPSGAFGGALRPAVNPRIHAGAAVDHAARLHVAVHRAALDAFTRRGADARARRQLDPRGPEYMKTFFDMGGYAPYLWPSYGVTFAVVLLNVWWA